MAQAVGVQVPPPALAPYGLAIALALVLPQVAAALFLVIVVVGFIRVAWRGGRPTDGSEPPGGPCHLVGHPPTMSRNAATAA